MRKRLIAPEGERPERGEDEWLDLERVAVVELTSEDDDHPIESALVPGDGPGWRASAAGEQLVRLVFDEPRRLSRIQLVFEETDELRTQEFVLRWAPGPGEPARDIVRQQWNFHPGCTREDEDYRVELSGVGLLELAVTPDTAGGGARASLRSLRLA